LAGALLLAASVTPVPWMPTVALLLLPLMVSSVGRGIAHPSMLTLVSEGSSAANRGGVMGTFQASASLARVASPLAAGALYDSWYWSPFVLCGALMVVVWGLALTLRSAPPVSAPVAVVEATGG
jgi:MFS family permease